VVAIVEMTEPTAAPIRVPATPREEAATAVVTAASAPPTIWGMLSPAMDSPDAGTAAVVVVSLAVVLDVVTGVVIGVVIAVVAAVGVGVPVAVGVGVPVAVGVGVPVAVGVGVPVAVGVVMGVVAVVVGVVEGVVMGVVDASGWLRGSGMAPGGGGGCGQGPTAENAADPRRGVPADDVVVTDPKRQDRHQRSHHARV
jgi:hypothetical protein